MELTTCHLVLLWSSYAFAYIISIGNYIARSNLVFLYILVCCLLLYQSILLFCLLLILIKDRDDTCNTKLTENYYYCPAHVDLELRYLM